MDNEKMFEAASRAKLRVPTSAGMLGVEDLWDLSLPKLNTLAKGLNQRIKALGEEDFLETGGSPEDAVLKAQFDIVLHILKTKKAEQEERAMARERAERKQKLLAALESKRENALGSMTEEELQAEIAALK